MDKQQDDSSNDAQSAHSLTSESSASLQDLPCLTICQKEEAASEKKPESPWQSPSLVQPVSTSTQNASSTELKPFRCCITADRLNQLRKKVEDAIKEKKTFTIKGGFQYIRSSLMQRGWLEKIDFKVRHNFILTKNIAHKLQQNIYPFVCHSFNFRLSLYYIVNNG